MPKLLHHDDAVDAQGQSHDNILQFFPKTAKLKL